MKKSLIVSACLSCLLVASANAQQPYRAPYAGYGHGMPPPQMTAPVSPVRQKEVSEVEEAGAVLKAGLKKLLGFFNNNQAPSRQLIAAFLDKEIAPYFDFAYMTKWVAGGPYMRMSDQQKMMTEQQLKTQFLSTMAQKLSTFNNQRVKYLAPKVQGKGQVELSIAIMNRGGYPARLDFRLYKGKDGWKVYDVSANGSSALVYYRQYFRQQMQRQRMQSRFR
jgi:phospholipid transport system substrate-binding protein